LIFSLQKKLLFTHVSRTGGTTIGRCLRHVLADSESLLGQHEPLAAARPILGARFDDLFKFAFVRNPWDRFVSWYALIALATNDRPEPGAASVDPDTEHWRGFDAFLEDWSAETMQIEGVTRRRMSQWAQLSDSDGALLTDDYGRFENFGADAARLFATAGISCPEPPTLNPSRHHHYSVYYSNFGRELVESVFHEDVNLLGYRFDALS
jgi:hypothetical protein